MKLSAHSPTDEAPEALATVHPDLVTRLAELAPDAGQPSRAILSAALLRVDPPRPRSGPTAVLTWSGWAVAACLALGVGLEKSGWWPGFLTGGQDGKTSGRGTAAIPPGRHGEPQPASEAELTGIFKDRTGQPDAGVLPGRRGHSLTAVQDMEQLRADLGRLRAANDARFQGADGLSRTVVVEMTDPADPREARRSGTLKLSERVAESIAAGVAAAAAADKKTDPSAPAPDPSGSPPAPAPEPPSAPPPPAPAESQDLRISGGDGSWSGDIVIEKGLPNAGMFNLPEGTQIRHLDFPVEEAANFRGLQDLGSGWFYDRFGDLLWQPSGQGGEYLGSKAPNGFDPESFTAPAVVESTETPQTPPVQEVPPAATETPIVETAPPDSGAAPVVVEAPPVRGYPIFDETTGSGSIILQNLPPAGVGESYQLWVTDPASSQPISVGLMPAMEAGGGRIWFDLGGPGVAPSGYLMTLEPATGSSIPTGRIVLKGP
ncbi:MAG: hypothetical protein JWL81_17 [Verrucomicrobiales bacterium]|nr:hypothetical protein [Verrucomicrobiales bacterium]